MIGASRLLWPYLRPYRLALVVAMVAMVGEIATSLLLPVPIQRAVDVLVTAVGRAAKQGGSVTLSGGEAGQVAELAGALLLIALFDAMFTYLDTANTARVAQTAVTDLRRALFNHLQRLSLSFHHGRDTRTGDLQLRLSGDVSNLQVLVGTVVGGLITNAGTAAFMLGGLFLLDWRLGAVVLAGSAPVYLLSRHYGGKVRQAVREARRHEGRVSALLAETLASAKLVQVFGREDHESDRMVDATSAGLAYDLRATEAQARLQPAVTIVTSGVTALTLLFGALLVLNGGLTVGLLTLALAYTRGTFSAFRQLARLPIQTQRAAISAERLSETFGRVPDVRDPAHAVGIPVGPLDIEFDAVSFGYTAGRPVLDDLSWRIEAGTLVALVGPTGAGKTTALALVPRLYDVWAGEVRVGGLDVRKVRVADLRSKVTLILQESLLFRDTIWNNIAYGRPGATADEVMAAAADAGILSFVAGLEDGLETMVSERGSTLSGGQKQCVALARAMLRDAPIVIMDEPTSSLDAGTEQLVIRGIAKLIAGRTAIVIAHRFSTIQGADVVAVMEAGKIVEIGSPDELLDNGGLFAKLSRIQGLPASTAAATADTAHRVSPAAADRPDPGFDHPIDRVVPASPDPDDADRAGLRPLDAADPPGDRPQDAEGQEDDEADEDDDHDLARDRHAFETTRGLQTFGTKSVPGWAVLSGVSRVGSCQYRPYHSAPVRSRQPGSSGLTATPGLAMAEQSSPVDFDRGPGSENTGSEGPNGVSLVEERSAFLDAMAHAMQETLAEARTMVAEDVERQRAVHIAAINARREVEASRIHELADEDRKTIDTWASAERVRIQLERVRRTEELQSDLESSLAEHRSRIDREIASTEAAIAAHRADLDAFFATLSRQTDPVAIAQHATRRPHFPTFDSMAGGADAASPGVFRTEVPAPDAVHGAQDQPAAATTVPAGAAVRDGTEAVAVVDELAVKRARWWAISTALPEPPAELEPVGASADPNESDSGSASS